MREVSPPEDADRIEWHLLTVVEISSGKEAQEPVEYHTLHWRVENIVRFLKTGCRVEKLHMQQAKALHKAITLYVVTARRIMLLTLLGRLSSDMQAEAILAGAELRRMRVRARNCGLSKRADPASTILMVATTGGCKDRRSDPPPGHAIMRRGYARLQMRAIACEEIGICYVLVERPPPWTKTQAGPSSCFVPGLPPAAHAPVCADHA